MAKEKFSFKKLLAGLNPLDAVGWAKATVTTFKSVILIGLVALLVFGIGYLRGYKNRPIQVDMKDTTIHLLNGDGKQHELKIKDGSLYFDGSIVTAGNVKKLRPYGVHLHPKLAGGITTSGSPAAGLALEVAYAWNFNLDLLALYKFLGIGISYDIKLNKPIVIDNSSIGIGIGKDFNTGENAAIIYYAINF